MLGKKEEYISTKDKEIFKKINNQVEQNYYEKKREWIKAEYEKDDRYKSLDNIILEKERISAKLNKMNSQMPALIIALIIMYLSLCIPAISKLISSSLNSNIDYIIQIIATVIIFGYSIIDIGNSSDEFRCLGICKNVLEELEKKKRVEIKYKSNNICDDVKDIKRFLGI